MKQFLKKLGRLDIWSLLGFSIALLQTLALIHTGTECVHVMGSYNGFIAVFPLLVSAMYYIAALVTIGANILLFILFTNGYDIDVVSDKTE